MANGIKSSTGSLSPIRYSLFAIRRSLFLLHALALAHALVEQLQIVLDVEIVRILGLGLHERHARARIVTAQHVGIALVIEHFRGLADDADGLVVGAIGQLETAQLIIGRRQAHPGFGVLRARLDSAAEVTLGQPIVGGAIELLAGVEVVVRIAAQEPRRIGRVAGRLQWRGTAVGYGCRGLRVIGALRPEQVAELGRGLAAAQKQRPGECRHKYTTPTLTHRYTRPGRSPQLTFSPAERRPTKPRSGRPKAARRATLGDDG